MERFLIQNFADYKTMAALNRWKQPSKISNRTQKSQVDVFKFVFIGLRMCQGWDI